MTTIFEEETDEAAEERFEAETQEVGAPIEEAQPIGGEAQPIDETPPLESLVTPHLCGLLLSIPGAIRARQTGLEFWRLSEEEIGLLGEASHPLAVWLVRKYLNESVGMFAATAVALAAVYSPRVIQEQQLKRKQKGEAGPVYPADRQSPHHSPVESAPSSASADAASQWSSDNFSVPFQE
jgi:hypothetical protein